MRCVSRDGTVVVETIRLSGTGPRRDGERLRVKRGGYHLADVRTVEELTGLGTDLADLSERRRPSPPAQLSDLRRVREA
jgi:hypothetical protein